MTAEQALRARVASRLAEIRADHEHGAGYLAQRGCDLALALCDACDQGDITPDAAMLLLRQLCRDLARARMSMAPLVAVATLIDREIQPDDEAQLPPGHLSALSRVVAVTKKIQDIWQRAPGEIATHLRNRLPANAHVVTLSRSAVVEQALMRNADLIATVTVLESRPGGEGVDVARHLAASGHDWSIRLVPDAAAALAVHDATCCLAGADALLPGAGWSGASGAEPPAGFAVNKTGTYPLALAARAAGIPCYVLAESLKIAPANWQWQAEIFSPDLVTSAPIPGVTVEAAAFERVPLDLVVVLSEDGVLNATAIAARVLDLSAGYARLLVD